MILILITESGALLSPVMVHPSHRIHVGIKSVSIIEIRSSHEYGNPCMKIGVTSSDATFINLPQYHKRKSIV
ncbi:MAG: hypothetical protein HXS53_03660 [Theionarchaea archaeon]|nr:hypothetical protein [Theionarchaea archaeon]